MNFSWSGELSDEDVVENARKRLRASRKAEWVVLAISLVLAGAATWFTPKIFDLVESFAKAQRGVQWQWFVAGMSAGATVSGMLAFTWFWVLYSIVLFFTPRVFHRRDRLLVQYYDALHPCD